MSIAFISHGIENANFAQELAARLRSQGIAVWIAPDSILPGEEFVDAIQRGLSETTHFILIMSPEAFASQWVRLEINTAIRLEREGLLAIAPVEYRAGDTPLLLGNYQWIRSGDDVAQAMTELLKWIGTTQPGSWSRPVRRDGADLASSQESLGLIADEISACRSCALHAERHQTVPGVGPANARVMIVGEAPGPDEDKSGVPFSGASGDFLDELLKEIDIDRSDVYLTNLVKCHPPRKASPTSDQMDACSLFLSRQLEAIGPGVIVTLGATSLARFLPEKKLSAVHGQPQAYDGRLLFPMYHPAAALYQNRFRKILIDDFQAMDQYLKKHFKA